jgi:hypothetical protein
MNAFHVNFGLNISTGELIGSTIQSQLRKYIDPVSDALQILHPLQGSLLIIASGLCTDPRLGLFNA